MYLVHWWAKYSINSSQFLTCCPPPLPAPPTHLVCQWGQYSRKSTPVLPSASICQWHKYKTMSSPVLYVRLIYQKGQYRMVSMHVLTCVALCVRSVNGSTHSMMSSPVLPENDVLTCVAREWCHHLCCLRMLSSPVLPENDALTCVA